LDEYTNDERMMQMHYAHKSEDGRLEPVIDHLQKTAEKAKKFAEKIDAEEFGYVCGMLHDIGKFSLEFDNRLLNDGVKVDHSTAGAQEVIKNKILGSGQMSYCIAGHHSGLPDAGTRSDTADMGTLHGRLKKQNLPDYSDFGEVVDIKKLKVTKIPHYLSNEQNGFSLSFFTRMLYSCLVDADFLATEEFMNPDKKRKSLSTSVEELYKMYQSHVKPFFNPTGKLNQERTKILNECLKKGQGPKGLYSLTVATGGGKTLASMGFALEQMKKHHLDRIIYVIPYTSIIHQTAAIFRDIFGEGVVLEHHMKVDYDDKDETDSYHKLATENWDAQIVVTTNVQFFESLYGNRSSACRKLHNIVNSVIIFDEAQMFPIEYLKPCVRTIAELVKNYNCTAVLCSATQPALADIFPVGTHIQEINSHWEEGKDIFKRTKFVFDDLLNNAELAKRLQSEKQVLCIVNTKRHAQDLYKLLPEGEGNFHLSTFMTPKDIQRIISIIKERLKADLVCRVISTSLIEAGVDLDFAAVYRAETGIDSELQAGGRCNREGKRPLEESIVHIFMPEEIYTKRAPVRAKQMIETQRLTIRRYGEIESGEAIQAYFRKLYDLQDENGLDSKGILDTLEKSKTDIQFTEISQMFKLIDTMTRPIVVIEDNEAANLVNKLRFGEKNRNVMRKINQYCVGVYEYQYRQLLDAGAIEPLGSEAIFVLRDFERYDPKWGLVVEQKLGEGVFL